MQIVFLWAFLREREFNWELKSSISFSKSPLPAFLILQSASLSLQLLLCILLCTSTIVGSSCAGGTAVEDVGTSSEDVQRDEEQTDHIIVDTQIQELEVSDDSDTTPDLEEELLDTIISTVCIAGAGRCIGTQREVCSDDGSGWMRVSCPTRTYCDDGECVEIEQVCTPGTVTCDDYQTVRLCPEDGLEWELRSCGSGERCFNGACRAGRETGAFCQQDSECAGGYCWCKNSEGCPDIQGGYCTSINCEAAGCAPNEACVNFDLYESGRPNKCLKGCESCERDAFTCRDMTVVTEDELSWAPVCFPDARADVGGGCSGPSDCLGNLCLSDIPSGFCSMRCDGRSCSPGSLCVDWSGQGWICAPECSTDEECGDVFVFECRFLVERESESLVHVCYAM